MKILWLSDKDKITLRQLRNIAMVSEKLYRNTLKSCVNELIKIQTERQNYRKNWAKRKNNSSKDLLEGIAKWTFYVQHFFLAKVAIIKTKSATIAFYSSPPFLLLALAPFFFLRSYDFGASRA